MPPLISILNICNFKFVLFISFFLCLLPSFLWSSQNAHNYFFSHTFAKLSRFIPLRCPGSQITHYWQFPSDRSCHTSLELSSLPSSTFTCYLLSKIQTHSISRFSHMPDIIYFVICEKAFYHKVYQTIFKLSPSSSHPCGHSFGSAVTLSM